MTGSERAQAAKALAKAKIAHVIKTGDSVQDVLDVITRQCKINQAKAQGRG